MGSPPPAGLKKDVLKFRSVRSIVIAPARTGSERSNKIAVSNTDHTKRGIRSSNMPGVRILITVVIKFAEPKIDEAPARWREKIAKSTEGPAWATSLARGGYTVHPVPAPLSTAAEASRRVNEGGRSQNLILFIRENAISGAPIIIGSSQLPNPPIIIGITIKKIIIKA